MSITFRNLATGEEISVSNIKSLGDREYFFSVRNAGCGKKFFNRNVCFADNGGAHHNGKNGQALILREGWEPVDAPKVSKPRTPKAPKAPKAEPTTAAEPTSEPSEPTTTRKSHLNAEPNTVEPLPEPSAEPMAEPTVATAATLLALADTKAKTLKKKYGEMAEEIILNTCDIVKETVKTTVNPDDVAHIVDERIERWTKSMPQLIQTIELKLPAGNTKQMTGTFHAKFKVFRNLVNAGKPVYFYGPAGCGKSFMAKQIADSLDLPYYETSQAMFAHDLKGYGDANGRYVETPFYKAFSGGGIFFLDEVDASNPEAIVVLNNAIANKRFDFPVVGNVTAHKDFRVIAAGNTRMTGATIAYTARQCQDTSFKNRFFFELVGYDERIELAICGGDKEIVEFAHDIRSAARKTNILQLCSYRQIEDLATLQECCENDLPHLVRGSVLQEKEVDEVNILYQNLVHKNNKWAKAMLACYEQMKDEEVW